MSITVKKLALWTREIGNQPGTLASVLGALAGAKADLQVVMAYEKPGDSAACIVELAPVRGTRMIKAALAAGLSEAAIPCLIVEGENQVGLGHAICSALGDAGINIQFVVATATGKVHGAVFGFGPHTDLAAATQVIRSAIRMVQPKRPAQARKSAKPKKAVKARKPARRAR